LGNARRFIQVADFLHYDVFGVTLKRDGIRRQRASGLLLPHDLLARKTRCPLYANAALRVWIMRQEGPQRREFPSSAATRAKKGSSQKT
jgi:hypothetical protein